MRPIFSPTDFIQIKGRGTRRPQLHSMRCWTTALRSQYGPQQKTAYKLFDFFANCEYFEEEFNYDRGAFRCPCLVPVLAGPHPARNQSPALYRRPKGHTSTLGADILATLQVANHWPRRDAALTAMFFVRFEDVVRQNPDRCRSASRRASGSRRDGLCQPRSASTSPTEFYTLDKLRSAAAEDRRLSLREILEKIFGLITRFKSKDELLEEEFAKFVADRKPPKKTRPFPRMHRPTSRLTLPTAKFARSSSSRHYTDLATNPAFSTLDFRAVPEKYRTLIPEYVKDYVSLNQFAP